MLGTLRNLLWIQKQFLFPLCAKENNPSSQLKCLLKLKVIANVKCATGLEHEAWRTSYCCVGTTKAKHDILRKRPVGRCFAQLWSVDGCSGLFTPTLALIVHLLCTNLITCSVRGSGEVSSRSNQRWVANSEVSRSLLCHQCLWPQQLRRLMREEHSFEARFG